MCMVDASRLCKRERERERGTNLHLVETPHWKESQAARLIVTKGKLISWGREPYLFVPLFLFWLTVVQLATSTGRLNARMNHKVRVQRWKVGGRTQCKEDLRTTL